MGLGILCGLGAGFFWGMSFLVPLLLPSYSPVQVALGRFFFFGLVSIGVLARNIQRTRQVLNRRVLGTAVLMSVTGYSLYYVILTESIRRCGITISSLIIGLLPLTIALAGRSRPKALGLFRLSLVLIGGGILLLNVGAFQDGSEGTFSKDGVLLSILSLLSWTYFAIHNARFLKTNPHIDNTTWTNLLGICSLLGMLFLAAIEPLYAPESSGVITWFDSPALGSFLIWTAVLGVGSTWIATMLWNIASSRLPTSLTGQLIVSETVFALLFGYFHSGSLPTAREASAITLLLCGVVLGIRSFRKAD